jgi:predicted Zn finger-like uncharacterized protein
MIIQCEQCRTKFKLDDSKVAEKSIKVRCARCRNVFSVAGVREVREDSASFGQKAPVFKIEEDLELTAAPVQESAVGSGSDFSSPANVETDFSFSSADSAVTHDLETAQKVPDSLDFGAFDVGDESRDAAEQAVSAQAMDSGDTSEKQEQTATPPKEGFGGLDFSGDDMFGDVTSTPLEDEASDSISFDTGIAGIADSLGGDSSSASRNISFDTQKPATENPFSLDDIEFGDELTSVTVQQVNPEELKPGRELLFTPLATTEAPPMPESPADTLEKTAQPPVQEDFPPLLISSRRKESSRISGILVVLGLIIAGLAAFYGYRGYVMSTEDTGKITGETGRISIRSVEASFVRNNIAGDLLVINGEAVNEYSKPRAAIQIKGIVFGPDGKEVSSKSAFCGNPLSKEQLETMSMDKIEEAMANQFGDSLANMEVATGASIPFVIVMPKPPVGASDYGVEPVGSTVATGKDK